MTTNDQLVKAHSTAILKNVTACMVLLDTLMNRPANLPGLGVFSGPSGDGKTMASQYAQNRLGATYIEFRHYWTTKNFCEFLLIELGENKPRGSLSRMMTQIINRLGDRPECPLIIDEADKLVDKGGIELVRDIYETTQIPILLVGEELLPQKLAEFERVHNRVLEWALTQPCDLQDVKALGSLLCRDVVLADDLLEQIRTSTHGRARRIATTLHEVENFARNHGLKTVDAKGYLGRIITGEAPRRFGKAS
jgi:DNA transposition AAA+ family ATPase